MIQVEGLKKSYGATEALRGVSFEIGSGEIVGLLGPNGAGKSTTIKILTGYMHPDAGTVTIDGLDVLAQPREVQARIGYLSENTPLYPSLSVQSYLKFMADLRDIPEASQKALLSDAIYATALVQHRARPIAQLSKGLRQRVGVAQAILHKPKVVILDEPTIGLDPTQIVEIRQLIKRLAEHSTVLFSSHILAEVEAVCDRVIIIINGQVHADSRLADLATTTNTILVLQQAVEQVPERLAGLEPIQGIESYRTHDGYPAYRIVSQDDIANMIYEVARTQDWPLRELRHEMITLESIFSHLVATA
ncbi:MAG TPA: ABC transporter ATP-binding protein [Aggregatilineales bacterium]|nr:ABC transporter ATP-binding protein [Aggregatilineales bacterium]